MRNIPTSNLNNTPTTTTTGTLAIAPTSTATVTPSSSITTSTTHSLWNSPIPYLFGGLAAMLGLIAFALLILAFTYKRLTGQLQNQDGGNRDLEKGDPQKKEQNKVYEEKFLVIMAGDEKPTFLATPVCPKSLSFGVDVGNELDKEELGDREVCDKSENEMDNDHFVVGGTSTQENEGFQETRQQQRQQQNQ